MTQQPLQILLQYSIRLVIHVALRVVVIEQFEELGDDGSFVTVEKIAEALKGCEVLQLTDELVDEVLAGDPAQGADPLNAHK